MEREHYFNYCKKCIHRVDRTMVKYQYKEICMAFAGEPLKSFSFKNENPCIAFDDNLERIENDEEEE